MYVKNLDNINMLDYKSVEVEKISHYYLIEFTIIMVIMRMMMMMIMVMVMIMIM